MQSPLCPFTVMIFTFEKKSFLLWCYLDKIFYRNFISFDTITNCSFKKNVFLKNYQN